MASPARGAEVLDKLASLVPVLSRKHIADALANPKYGLNASSSADDVYKAVMENRLGIKTQGPGPQRAYTPPAEAVDDAPLPAGRDPLPFEERIAREPKIRSGLEDVGVDTTGMTQDEMLEAAARMFRSTAGGQTLPSLVERLAGSSPPPAYGGLVPFGTRGPGVPVGGPYGSGATVPPTMQGGELIPFGPRGLVPSGSRGLVPVGRTDPTDIIPFELVDEGVPVGPVVARSTPRPDPPPPKRIGATESGPADLDPAGPGSVVADTGNVAADLPGTTRGDVGLDRPIDLDGPVEVLPSGEAVTQIDVSGPRRVSPDTVDFTDPLNPPPQIPWRSPPNVVTGRTLTPTGRPELFGSGLERFLAGTALGAAGLGLYRYFNQPSADAQWTEPPVEPQPVNEDLEAVNAEFGGPIDDDAILPLESAVEDVAGAPEVPIVDVDVPVAPLEVGPLPQQPTGRPTTRPPGMYRQMQRVRDLVARGDMTPEAIEASREFASIPESYLARAINSGLDLQDRRARVRALNSTFGGAIPGNRQRATMLMNAYMTLDPENRDAFLLEHLGTRKGPTALDAIVDRRQAQQRLDELQAKGAIDKEIAQADREGRLAVAGMAREDAAAGRDKDLAIANMNAEARKAEIAAEVARSEAREREAIRRGNAAEAAEERRHRQMLGAQNAANEIAGRKVGLEEKNALREADAQDPNNLLGRAHQQAMIPIMSNAITAAQELRQRGRDRQTAGTTLRKNRAFFMLDDATLSGILDRVYGPR